MICVICRQASVEPGTTTVTLTQHKLTFVVRDVPARVCPNCGETYVDEAATERVLATANELAQAGSQVDIRDYKAA